jgi:hypothetical protein
MTRDSVAELPPLGHPTTATDAGELTEICTVLPVGLPNEARVC